VISKDPKVLKAIDRLAKAAKRFEETIKSEGAAFVRKMENDPFWAQTTVIATLTARGALHRDVLDTWIETAGRTADDRDKLAAFAEWQMAMVGLHALGLPGNSPHAMPTVWPGAAN
jgi:hypothetical protein